MSVILIGLFTYRDRAAYDRYVELATPIFAREKVIFFVNDEAPRVTSGEIEVDKVVVMQFRDKAHMAGFFAQDDYQAAATHRDAGINMTTLMVKGLPQGADL